MGIYDRDYMKRTPDRDRSQRMSGEERLEQFFSRFLRRHRRWLLGFGLVMLGLILIGLLWTVLSP